MESIILEVQDLVTIKNRTKKSKRIEKKINQIDQAEDRYVFVKISDNLQGYHKVRYISVY